MDLINLVQSLPDELILEILSLLPSNYVSQFFLHLPTVRPLVIENYYSNELHFILAPPARPHYCPFSQQRKEIIDFDNFNEIDEFLSENPDISPKTFSIITRGDFRSFETLIKKYSGRFLDLNRTNLQFHIERYELNICDLELISRFSSKLTKLQFTQTELKVLRQSPTFLADFVNLDQLVILGHRVNDWSGIKLPPNLNQLDVSWNKNSNILTKLELPESLNHLYWNQIGVDNTILREKVFPKNLKTLMLTYNNISEVDVDQLPRSLETLDLLENCIALFTSNHTGGGSWPPFLKSLLLSNNQISNTTLESLSRHKWPESLQNLKLNNNPLTSLENLTGVPDSIEYLDLSDTELTSLGVILERRQRELGTYPFFKFPRNLKTLNLSCNGSLILQKLETQVKILFPNLTSLNIDECKIESLDCFNFPLSLCKLSLCGNKIKDLTSYECSGDSWLSLTSLSHLELFFNQVDSLENWKPPQNLKYLDLGKNQLSNLTMNRTPIFQASNSDLKLQTLRLENNSITALDGSVIIPPYLQTLLLKDNLLSGEVHIPVTFTTQYLETLDLGNNSIEGIVFARSSSPSLIRNIDLTRNQILKLGKTQELIQKFYTDIENSLAIKVLKRKANVNSMHIFS